MTDLERKFILSLAGAVAKLAAQSGREALALETLVAIHLFKQEAAHAGAAVGASDA